MSRGRGLNLQNELARYLAANGWPSAQSVGSGRGGVDVLHCEGIDGTPGVAWENKTADEFRILEFVRQARSQAGALDVPVVAYWPRGAGAMSVAHIPTILPMAWTVRLLRGSGYGDPLPESWPTWVGISHG
jgi:hypothetical protein